MKQQQQWPPRSSAQNVNYSGSTQSHFGHVGVPANIENHFWAVDDGDFATLRGLSLPHDGFTTFYGGGGGVDVRLQL